MNLPQIRKLAEKDLLDFLERLAQDIAYILSRAGNDSRKLAQARKQASALVEQRIGSEQSAFYALLVYWLLYTVYQVALDNQRRISGYTLDDRIRIDRLYDTPEEFVDSDGLSIPDRVKHAALRIQYKMDVAILRTMNNVEPDKLPDAIRKLWTIEARKPTDPVLGYDLWRILRHEIGNAWGIAILTSAHYNPAIGGVDWALSPRHPKMDHCDKNASIGMDGQRLKDPYPMESVPRYPDHPFCLCELRVISAQPDGAIPAIFNDPVAFTQLVTGRSVPYTIIRSK